MAAKMKILCAQVLKEEFLSFERFTVFWDRGSQIFFYQIVICLPSSCDLFFISIIWLYKRNRNYFSKKEEKKAFFIPSDFFIRIPSD